MPTDQIPTLADAALSMLSSVSLSPGFWVRIHIGNEENRILHWQVYIILCADDSLYTGITTDIERRFRQHAEGRGARYFRGRSPMRVVFLEGGHCRSTASRREMEIKKMPRSGKKLLIASRPVEINSGERNPSP